MIDAGSIWVPLIAGFALVALASKQVGDYFHGMKLPLISGFLFTGIIAGPFVLELIPTQAIGELIFIDELSLAFISFAAGSELFVRQLKSRLKSIRYTTFGLVLSTFVLGSASFFLLCEYIPFAKNMSPVHRLAVSILAGAILVARSPSSAIAVVNELKAKGPFTKTVLGVTVVMDVLVIAIFGINASIAATLLTGEEFDAGFLFFLLGELALTLALGYLLGKVVQFILPKRIPRSSKTAFILAAGYGVFELSTAIRHLSDTYFSSEILLEPMLICMVGSFLTTNYSHYRTELIRALHGVGPYIYVAFFTLTGASLSLDVLAQCWAVALVLFFVRLVGIFIGTVLGGFLAGEKGKYNKIAWMGYITQAGVGLGLAKDVTFEFPEWGAYFATIIIAVIVLNQILGPPLFKLALFLAREVHTKEEDMHDGIRDAVIFGLEGESIALARLLQSNNWEVKIVTTQLRYVKQEAKDSDIEIHSITDFTMQTMRRIGVGQADAIVAMMSDEENYKICELMDAHFGTRVIVRLNNPGLLKRFSELGAMVVEPNTAMVSLLDQFVRSPSTATLLLGMEQERSIIEFELRNHDLHGIAIRDLHLPLDLHILSIRRQGQFIVSGGFTRVQIGDWLTVVGSQNSLEQMMLQFGENREHAIVYMVEKMTSKKIVENGLEKEVKEIMHEKDDAQNRKFNQLIEKSIVLDLKETVHYEKFFRRVARKIATSISVSEEALFQHLMEREAESSTVLRPDLAIPHIIIEGKGTFYILLARCKKGIHFSKLAPKVQTVFVLVGTKDERDYHLFALSAIAKMVQQARFREKWLKAKNTNALRNIAFIRSP